MVLGPGDLVLCAGTLPVFSEELHALGATEAARRSGDATRRLLARV